MTRLDDATYRAEGDDLDHLDRLNARRERFTDAPARPGPRTTWREWLAMPQREPSRCAVTGCERVGMIYVSPWAFVCLDCYRALAARGEEGDDE